MFNIQQKILYINLDSATERKDYIESQFTDIGLSPIRIPAISYTDISSYLEGKKPTNMSDREIACVISHLKAIKYFIEETNDKDIFICEDDLSLETVEHWDFSFNDIYNNLPYNYDVCQFTLINPAHIDISFHRSHPDDFSAGAYLITRHHALKIYNAHIKNDKYKLDNKSLDWAVSERVLFASGVSYAMAILACTSKFDSQVQDLDKQAVNTDAYNVVVRFWKENSKKISLNNIMKF